MSNKSLPFYDCMSRLNISEEIGPTHLVKIKSVKEICVSVLQLIFDAVSLTARAYMEYFA
jgi:hypothetical protein